jgi:uncharacterized damage-inducible protein DinB
LDRTDHIRLMASYNKWMNVKLYDAAAKLSAEELALDKGAFFGSVLGTLNHIINGDTIWLRRFATHPANFAALEPIRQLPHPTGLAQVQFSEFAGLLARRQLIDDAILQWADEVKPVDLDHVLHYVNSLGAVGDKHFFSVVMHFFNHQTHHRGQVTTLLSQAGIDVGVTDLLMLIDNQH